MVRCRQGFTLVEVMVAAAILGFTLLVLFNGVMLSTKLAHESAQLIAAQDYAAQRLWELANCDKEEYINAKKNFNKKITLAAKEIPERLKDGSPVVCRLYSTNKVNGVNVGSRDIGLCVELTYGPETNVVRYACCRSTLINRGMGVSQ